MSARNRRTLAAGLVVAALVATPTIAAAEGSNAKSSKSRGGDASHRDRVDSLTAIGLAREGTRLVRFDTDDPNKARTVGTVRGLSGDASLVGIDYRVQDALLYGVGDAGGIYVLSERNASAKKVGQLTVPLDGAAFGVDFNPAADALRVVSDTGQNLRHPFAGATAGQTQVDARLTNGTTAATGSSAAAYTNNDLDAATATTLFDIDKVLNQVALQSPANAGTLAATGMLGVDAELDAGFDIYSTLRNGRTADVTGFATLGTGTSYALYRITLLTGEARKLGSFASPVTDIAVQLDQR